MKRLVVGYAALRIVYAAGLLAAPGRIAKPWLGDGAAGAAGSVALRGLGARDGALAVGAIVALASGGSARPWLAACAASDAADLIATLVADGDELPARAKPGTVMAAGGFGAAGAALALSSAGD